ncbi:lantibiotic dehydratase family protein [Tenacibaculum amylolyticum]|uniref:lantibiotic dehydratase family protein n=1 Tax=Tenacibaculum amylolyticum TaxID=104269 RepID=UPI0038B61387
MRVPLFSITKYKEFIKKGTLSDADFIKIIEIPFFKEAIFLASPILLEQIEKWENGLLKDPVKKEKLKVTILKYYTRMSSRCTPFGLFASCSLGSFNSYTDIQLETINNYKRVTQFDNTFLSKLSLRILLEEEVKNSAIFFPNTTLYEIDNHYRYIEYSIKKNNREYSLEGVHSSPVIDKIITTAKQGRTITQLAQEIVDNEVNFEEAKEFILILIENQILVSEYEISSTGENYFLKLLRNTTEKNPSFSLNNQLQAVKSELDSLDHSFENTIDNYKKVISKTEQLVPDLDLNYLFQTDTFSATQTNNLDYKLKYSLLRAIKFFTRISFYTPNHRLEGFKREFLKRYETQQLPLSLVLDSETGIGYGSKQDNHTPYLDHILVKRKATHIGNVEWTAFDDVMQQKLYEATKENSFCIELKEEDVNHLPENWNHLATTFYSLIEIYKKENSHTIFMKGAGGSSGINLLSRFAHGDPEIYDHIKNIVTTEEQIHSDKIIAEIVHLPESRTGNILKRPNVRSYEIPYLASAGVKKEFEIPIEDILISIKNNRIVLRSKKHQKEIIPKLSNAHNYTQNSLAIYQFLCELQLQNKRSNIGFSWNSIFLKLPFLPRVVFKNIIFSKAKWNIKVHDFTKIMESNNIVEAIKNWQQKLALPDYVELVDGDNRLLIYLQNKTALTMLYQTVKKRTHFLLEEFLFSDDEIVQRNEESFCNQFVISYHKKMYDTQN